MPETAWEQRSVEWAVADGQHASEMAGPFQVEPQSSQQSHWIAERVVLLAQKMVAQHYSGGLHQRCMRRVGVVVLQRWNGQLVVGLAPWELMLDL